jgi:basic amino acid/polyamine antiporter, APA family
LSTPASPAGGPSGIAEHDHTLSRSISGRLLFFYVLGDVLGSGIYVLVGLVAGEVGGAFWAAFALGVGVAVVTGCAYAELATKYPQAAGAALYVSRAFKNRFFTFVMMFCMLSASFAAAGALALSFGGDYFKEFLDLPTTLVALAFIVVLALLNFRGISESVKANFVMTLVEISGLLIVLAVGAAVLLSGDADVSRPFELSGDGNPVLVVLGGAALAFFAMTGFENTANVAEETRHPTRVFPRALIGGVAVAGALYVLVAIATSLVVPTSRIAGSESALLEVVGAGPIPVPSQLFAAIALIAVTNTALVALVTQSRIMYGMAREGAVPQGFARVHRTRRTPWVAIVFTAAVVMVLLLTADVERLATVTVVFLIFIYALVCAAALKLRRERVAHEHYTAPTALLVVGILGNVALLAYTVVTDPGSLTYCGVLLLIGLVLYFVNNWTQQRLDQREPGAARAGVR